MTQGVLYIKEGGQWVLGSNPGPQGEPGFRGPYGPVGPRGIVGPAGDTIPVGGLPGEYLVKTSDVDREVGWTDAMPRGTVHYFVDVDTVFPSTSWVNMCVKEVWLEPTRMYLVEAGFRCVSDPNADCNMQMLCRIGAIGSTAGQVFDDYLNTMAPGPGNWGSWAQRIVQPGTYFTSVPAFKTAHLVGKFSVAGLRVYAPRIVISDVGKAP